MTAVRARGAALAVLAAALVLATSAARAGAVESVGPAARGLADSRLYVDPAVAGTVDTATRTRIAFNLARRREAVYVALVPFAPGDAFDGDGPRFLTALAGRLQRPGIYVTYDARGILWTRAYRTASAIDDHARHAADVTAAEGTYNSPPGPRIESFLAAVDESDAQLTARERRAA